jgi:MarR family transcriptional regulator, multiple antibiotic resistance protein MarR
MKKTTFPTTHFYTPETYTPQGSLVYLMVRNKSIYQRLADMRLADLGITASQMSVLMMVGHGEKATISSISQLWGINAAATVRIVQKLEEMQLIKKLPSNKDGRVTHLSLTTTGKRLIKYIPDRLCDLLNHSLMGFTLKEFEQLKSFLLRIEANNLQQLKEAQ